METPELDNVRKPWESEQMWNLRRAFLERHWLDSSMTRNRLICLSQIFVNMEFLDCQYDESLMVKVRDMSEGLLEERREQRSAVIQEVFANTKPRTTREGPSGKKRKGIDETFETKSTRVADVAVVVTTTHPVCAVKMKVLQALKAEMIVMQQQRLPNDPLTVMNQACGRVKCHWRIQFDNGKNSCYLHIDDVIVVEHVYWGSQTRSRVETCRRAIDVLQRPFFDVRQISEKAGLPGDIEMELYTRRDPRGEWDPPSLHKFEPLEKAFTGLRKRLVSVPQEMLKKSPEKCFRDAATAEDLPIEMKRQHLGGWKEEILVTVGKVELYRYQGQIPPKGKEQESTSECYSKSIDVILKPSFSDGISISDDNGTLTINAMTKSAEKASIGKIGSRRSSHESHNDTARKELALKSVRLHLNATSKTMHPVQRIEQACAKAKVPYEVTFDSDTPFAATVFVDGVRTGDATDTTKKAAKSKACQLTIEQLLQPYIRIKEDDDGGGGLTLTASSEPFGE